MLYLILYPTWIPKLAKRTVSYKGARESGSCGFQSVDWRVLLALIPNPWDEMNLLILRGMKSLGKD